MNLAFVTPSAPPQLLSHGVGVAFPMVCVWGVSASSRRCSLCLLEPPGSGFQDGDLVIARFLLSSYAEEDKPAWVFVHLNA